MKISQTLPKPANWSDFEDLCKKLWGEIWECREIQKNGRSGQSQSGVDIYGIPKGEDGYYGIQCKGKNEYSREQLTENEINIEVEAAKSFEPPLKKLYIATTAQNDAKVQTHVRKLNIEHRIQGLFEVHIFGWESIVDLIFENQRAYESYSKSSNFRLESELPCLKVIKNNYWSEGYTVEVENTGSDLFNLEFGEYSDNEEFKINITGKPIDVASGAIFKFRYTLIYKANTIIKDGLTFKYSDRHGLRYSQVLNLLDREPNVLFSPRQSI